MDQETVLQLAFVATGATRFPVWGLRGGSLVDSIQQRDAKSQLLL
jgi:hypothetical protein